MLNRLFLVSLITLITPPVVFADTSSPIEESWAAQRAKADGLRAEAGKERLAADEARQIDDAACQRKFFVNACLDTSRDKYLVRIKRVRTMEVQANRLERESKTKQLAEKDKLRPVKSPTAPPLAASAPLSQLPAATNPHPSPASAAHPKPTVKPIDPVERAASEQKKQTSRALAAQKATERAEKARTDKARYEARAQAAAAKKAARAQQNLPNANSDASLPPPPPPPTK